MHSATMPMSIRKAPAAARSSNDKLEVILCAFMQAGNQQVEADARRIGQYTDDEALTEPRDLANRLLTSVYMGTVNSSPTTRERAARLAKQVGADHLDVNVDGVVDAMAQLFATITGHVPRFRVRLLLSA